MRSKEEILAVIRRELSENFGVPAERVTPEADLYADLDIDSIDAIDLLVKMQKLTGRRIRPEDFKSVRTVGDVAEVLERVLSAGDGAKP